MATLADPSEPVTLDIQEQIARIAKTQEDIYRAQAEARILAAEERKLAAETGLMPRSMIFQAMLATAALLGAGAAIAKLFFP